MNSLNRLLEYGTSESEDEEEIYRNQERLPVPELNFINGKPVGGPPPVDKNHEGKIRNFPHEAGNWATHVRVPLSDPPSEFVDFLDSLSTFAERLQLKPVDDHHISLTRTVVLRHHWIRDFTESVRESISDVRAFEMHLRGLKTFCNERKTRTFLSMKVNGGEENLRVIVDKLNGCLAEYNLERFYDEPSFHLSLFWCVGDESERINESLKRMPDNLKSCGFFVKVSHCVCASGNKIFTFNFG